MVGLNREIKAMIRSVRWRVAVKQAKEGHLIPKVTLRQCVASAKTVIPEVLGKFLPPLTSQTSAFHTPPNASPFFLTTRLKVTGDRKDPWYFYGHLTACLACMYGQRGGVFQNMTIGEVEAVQKAAMDRCYLISISSHKDQPTQLALSEEEYGWMREGLVGGGDTHYLFFISKPSSCKNLNQYFQEAWAGMGLPISGPPSPHTAPADGVMSLTASQGGLDSFGNEDSTALPPSGVSALVESDPELMAMISRAAESIGWSGAALPPSAVGLRLVPGRCSTALAPSAFLPDVHQDASGSQESLHAVLCVAFAFEAVLTQEFCQTRPPWNAGLSLANTDRTRKLDHAPTQGRYASHVRAGRSATHTTDLALRRHWYLRDPWARLGSSAVWMRTVPYSLRPSRSRLRPSVPTVICPCGVLSLLPAEAAFLWLLPSSLHWPRAGITARTGHPMAPSSRSLEPPRVAPGRDEAGLSTLPPAVVATITSARASSTRHAYALKWNLFVNWCSSKHQEPTKCPISVMLSFLQEGLERRLSPSTLKVYVAAIAAHHDAVDGKSLGVHDLIIRFLRGARRLNPPRPPLVPSWELSVVLTALQSAPFEPLQSLELKFLSIKTALLVELASIKRVVDLQAFSVDEACLEFGPANSHVILRPRPGYVTKVPTTPFRDQFVNLQALPLEEAALRAYVDRTQCFRTSDQLFVCYGGKLKGKALSKQRLSYWIVDTIALAYQQQGRPCPLGVTAHSTQSVASAWALAHGASLTDI
ncbi:unnamed protein product [Leuciscus chuanchicus]